MTGSSQSVSSSFLYVKKQSLKQERTNHPFKRILIKGGTIVNAHEYEKADILIEKDKIIDIGSHFLAHKDTYIIYANDLLIMPGGIDPSTHFDFEFMNSKTVENFYTGTRAAVSGGTTMIMDYVMNKKDERLINKIEEVRSKADEEVVCDYGLHIAIGWFDDKVANELKVISEFCGINSIKVHMGFKDTLMLTDDIIYRIFIKCSELGLLPMIHAENAFIVEQNGLQLVQAGINGIEAHYRARTEESEGEGVFRACTLAKMVQCPLYVCHIMSELAAKKLIQRRNESEIPIFGEIIPASIGIKCLEPKVRTYVKTAYVRSPAIRQDLETPTKLLNLLSNGLLTLTASDDCSFPTDHKSRILPNNFEKIPCGVNGVEDRMSIIWDRGVNSGILTPCQFVAITSTNAAKIFNIYPQKGVIAIGSDADIVIWNPKLTRKISTFKQKQSCDYNIFHGLEVSGGPEVVIVKGKICLHKGIFKVEKGFGKFVKTEAFNKFLYTERKQDDAEEDED